MSWDVSSATNVAWKTSLPGVANSSPIVWEDRIYLTTGVPLQAPRGTEFRTPHAWRLLVMDRASGKILADTLVHEGTPILQRNPESSYANATPATDGRHIVAIFGTDALACFDRQGKMLWKKALPAPSKNDGYHFGSSPVIVGDLTIVQDDRDTNSYVAAYRLADGQEVWKVKRDEGASQSTPAVAWTQGANRRALVVLGGPKHVLALDARTGREAWRVYTNNGSSAASPVTDNDIVFFAAGGNQKRVYAIRVDAAGDISLAAGQQNNAGVVWSTARGGSHLPSPLVVRPNVFVLGDNGVLTAYNGASGRQLIQARAGTGDYYASPVAADGKIYIFNTEGEATVVRADATLEVVARNRMNEPVKATPAIVDGTLYVRTERHLVALRENGQRRGR